MIDQHNPLKKLQEVIELNKRLYTAMSLHYTDKQLSVCVLYHPLDAGHG